MNPIKPTNAITIIGTGVGPGDLTAHQKSLIEAADILVGGQRLLEPFAHLACEKRIVNKDLTGLVAFLQERMDTHAIVVLASGDPLFFGIAALLSRRLGAERVSISPNISAVAAAFARLGEPWQDVHVVSLHGRSHTGTLLRHLTRGEKVAVYTDPSHNPARLAHLLIENNLSDVEMVVLENLGCDDEKITRSSPESVKDLRFSDLNLVVLYPDPSRQQRPDLFVGMPDDRFVHENGLITKAEVRAVTLSRLKLFDRAVFWDLGAGSGSVSIEAGGVITRGEIFAVEHKPERVKQIHANRTRFAIGNMQVLQTRLPDGLDALPDPDRVFIGGGGRDLETIIRTTTSRLKPGGIVVVNTVVLENMNTALQTLDDLGLNVETVQIQVNRAKPMPAGQRLDAINPVWIISGGQP